MSVEIIFFDVVDVLLMHDENTFTNFESKHNFRPGEGWQIWRKYAKLVRKGQITPAQYPNYTYLAEVIDALNANIRPTPGIVNILELLTNSYRLSVISNFTPELEEVLEKAGLRNYFEKIINSALVGIRKPAPEIFRIACTAVNVEPEYALLIDDKQENVQGAIDFGMKAIRFTDVNTLRVQLIEQGITLDSSSITMYEHG